MTHMQDLSRRALLVSIVATSGASLAGAAAQQTDAPPAAAAAPAPFGYPDVVKRARDLAAAPFDSSIPPLPDGLANLDFDSWRDIRFKSDKPLLGQEGANFRLELFHLGHLYKRPVVVNVLRDGIRRRSPTPPICSTTATPSLACCRSTSVSPAFASNSRSTRPMSGTK